MARLSRMVLERLMEYYRFVSDLTAEKQVQTVKSAQIAEALEIDATQVRKDFGAIGLRGMGNVGFEACEVCRAIRITLGFDQNYAAILVGIGHLGGALLAYSGFRRYGLSIVAAFDGDKGKVGREIAGYVIKSTKELKPFIRRRNIHLAILTTPAHVTQALTDRVISAGVTAIWNFAPTRVTVPEGALVRNEHISIGLSEIAYHLLQ